MAEQGDVFPSRDLPGLSENWGRHVENRIEVGEKSKQQLEQKVDNGLRATGGQLAVLSEQMVELQERQVQVNRLSSPYTVYSNSSGDARGYWSSFEFTTSEPRGVVLTTDLRAVISSTVPTGAIMSPIMGVQTVPPLITQVVLYNVVNYLTVTGVGSETGLLRQSVYFNVLPGTYKVFSGIYNSGVSSGSDGATATLDFGVSVLSIGQPDPSITVSSIPQYTP